MNNKLICVDIDLTVIDTDLMWWDWLLQNFERNGKVFDSDSGIDHNLGKYFEGKNEDHMKFWSNPKLYCDVEIFSDAFIGLSKLKQSGFNFVFTSQTKSGHFSSKVNLVKNLPFVDFNNGDAFIATHEKGILSDSVVAVIDDRNKCLNQFGDNVLKIKYDTPYTQCEECKINYDFITNDWYKISDFIIDLV